MAQEHSDGNAPGIPELHGTIEELPGGLRYIDETVGDGEPPEAGRRVTVHYTGWLTDGGRFDSSRTSGRPFEFNLGQGQVIQGWDIGVASMRVGGKRRLIVPAAMGYGARGYPPVIPENATLIFDVELLGTG
jgi:peptidylprolyl isomerase